MAARSCSRTCFAAGVSASEVERDITAGGLDLVPAERLRRAGLRRPQGTSTAGPRSAPGFGTPGRPAALLVLRGRQTPRRLAVELEADAGVMVEWVELPIPRRLSVITGAIDDLLSDEAYAGYEGDWVSAILTHWVRPLDGMRKLQARFPHCVASNTGPRSRWRRMPPRTGADQEKTE